MSLSPPSSEEPPEPGSSLLSRCCAKVVMPSSPPARAIEQCHTWAPRRASASPGTLQCQEEVKSVTSGHPAITPSRYGPAVGAVTVTSSFQKYHPENVNCWNTVLLLAEQRGYLRVTGKVSKHKSLTCSARLGTTWIRDLLQQREAHEVLWEAEFPTLTIFISNLRQISSRKKWMAQLRSQLDGSIVHWEVNHDLPGC